MDPLHKQVLEKIQQESTKNSKPAWVSKYQMKVALVHDYLMEYGGAERVLEALTEIFPEATIYTAYVDFNGLGPHAKRLKSWKIKSSVLQFLPFARKLISPFRIFAANIFRSFDLKQYDLIISSCNTYFAKAVKKRTGVLHLSYIHTPPRYLYGYATSFNYKKHWWTRIGGELMNHFLRIQDFETSQNPDVLIANSKNVSERIKKFYRRDSVIIYPPVNVDIFLNIKKNAGKYFLSLSRLVRGKGVDVVVRACSQLSLPLKVVGGGPQLEELKKVAGKSIEFLGEVQDEELADIYANAKALIVASEDEDFGITSVEAQAAGTPVIAVRAGGYLESVVEGKTGEFFERAEVEELIKVLKEFDPKKYNDEDLRKNAQRFSKERFKQEILELVEKNIKII